MKLRFVALLVLSLLLAALLPQAAHANSSEPPSIVIIVNSADETATASLHGRDGEQVQAGRQSKLWETYFTFYRYEVQDMDGWALHIETGAESFVFPLAGLELNRFSALYTFNAAEGTLTPGKSFWRDALLVCTRLVCTLLIEAAVFWLFGFRSRRSWLVFLLTNLVTQGLLNWWINSQTASPLGYAMYLVLFLFVIELAIFIVEAIVYRLLLHEQTPSRRVGAAFLGNAASYAVGGFILMLLPL